MFESLLRNKRLRYRALLVLFCLFAGAMVLDRSINLDQASSNEPSSLNEPDLYMNNASISQIDNDGVIRSKIAANRFTHYPLTDVTTLERPNVILFSEDTDSPWTISSIDGRLLGGSEYRKQAVELWTEVTAEKASATGDKTTFVTEALRVYPSDNLAITDTEVNIFTATTETSAGGLRANLDQDEFAFRSSATQRVTTTIQLLASPAVD